MKKFLIPAIVLVVLVIFLGSVYAIPNPAPVYCEEMGYTSDGENCVFGDGERCEEWAFYRGECGSEYVKELACTTVGNSNLPGHECCENLVASQSSSQTSVNNGICDIAVGAWSVCLACGDGMCDDELENTCNCPEDCGKCYGEGESLPVLPGPSEVCCEGLRLISPNCDPNGIGLCPVGTAGICTAKCGNGECDTRLESAYNCPADCVPPKLNMGWDIDGDNSLKSETDGILLSRYLFGVVGEALTDGALGQNAIRTTPEEILTYLDYFKEKGYLDVDGDGRNDALTDGILVYRYLSGWTGDKLIQDALSPDAVRKTAEEIITFINTARSPDCICPLVYSPVCGVDGKTYGNKCFASCENVEVAYVGECRSDKIKVELGNKFELKEKQTALLMENGESIGVNVKLLGVSYLRVICVEGPRCGSDSYIKIEVSKESGNTVMATEISLGEGQSEKVFGITLTNKEIGLASASFVAERETVPGQLRVGLNEKFELLEDQTAYVIETGQDLMKLNFDGVVVSTCASGGGSGSNTSVREEQSYIKCENQEYAQFYVSVVDGTSSYITLRPGGTTRVGNYEVSLLSLRINRKYTAVLVVTEISDLEIVIAYLGTPFNLQQEQKAIVRETSLQMKLLKISDNTAVLEVLRPAFEEEAVSGTVANTSQEKVVTSVERARIVKEVKEKTEQGNMIYSPYIKVQVGESVKVYGHEITLNNIMAVDCGPTVDCVGGGMFANLTVEKETTPDVVRAFLNEKFELNNGQTALVIDRGWADIMKLRLLGVAVPLCDVAEEDSNTITCSARPIATVYIATESGLTKTFSFREGEERQVGGYVVRLLDLRGGQGVFIVKRSGQSDVIKVSLNEKFKLQTRQAAVVEEENLFIKLEGIAIANCLETEVNCIGGSYAKVSVWKNKYYNDKEDSPVRAYEIKEGGSLNLYGTKISLLELSGSTGVFIVKKDSGNVINVHVNEPFKLEERMAARVLEANMKIDLLGITQYTCITAPCDPSKVEISVTNYLFSKELTGIEIKEKDFLETVVEEESSNSVTGSSGVAGIVNSGTIPAPPKPFRIYTLGVGESVAINDYTIEVLDIGYGSAEFVVKKKGSDLVMKLELHNGWNLFSIPGEIRQVIEASDCESDNFRLFEYVNGSFVKVETPEKGKAFWLYNSGKTCSVKAVIGEAISMNEINPLTVKWNFVPVTVDMIGSKIREIASDCNPKAAFFFNSASGKWQNALNREINTSDLGKAFALYATNACSLGSTSTGTTPPIPGLPELEG